MQKALFPMQYLRVTQGEYSSYSHAGSPAMDFGGKDTGADKGYAPCDMKVVRVRTDSSHETYCESIAPVQWADGTVDYMNFTFMHDNYLNSNLKVGAIIKQGTHFYDEGGFGGSKVNRFAIHLHLEVGKGKSPAKQVKNSKGTYVTPGGVSIYKALFLPADCIVVNGGGYRWVKTEDKILNTSANSSSTAPTAPTGFKKYNIRPTSKLHIRKGPGTNFAHVQYALPSTAYTILEEKSGWGRTVLGWLSLQYTKRV